MCNIITKICAVYFYLYEKAYKSVLKHSFELLTKVQLFSIVPAAHFNVEYPKILD